MSVFLSLFFNLLPLYALIGAGFISGKFLHVDRDSLGTLAMYIFMPVVVFGFVANIDFEPSYIALPFILFGISAVVSLSFLKFGKHIYGDNQANLMAMCTAMGNTGYFGLPLVLLFFSKELVAIYIFMNLGSLIFEATIGYYIAARGNFDTRSSIKKILKFPTIYAIALGIAVNQSGAELPEIFWTYWTHFKGAYVIVGMMIIGAALSNIDKLVFGARFVALTFAGKFVVFPALAFAVVALDRYALHWYQEDIHNLIMIVSIVPPAANIAAFATQMKLEPEKAATTILIGTVFALFYIPAFIWMLNL